MDERQEQGGPAVWLIEMLHNEAPVPRYWNPSKFKDGWVWDANEAIRFSREQDARDFLDGQSLLLPGKPVEHMFIPVADPIAVARDCFLNMIADATRFDEDVDGDEVNGRTVITVDYHLTVGHSQLEELAESLGIKRGWQENIGDAIHRAIEQDCAHPQEPPHED